MSYILLKPETLGTDFKNMTCSVTGDLLLIEIHRSEGEIKKSKHHLDLGATAACMKRIMEYTKELGQRDVKGITRVRFIFVSWFSSKISAEAVIYVGADMVDMVKTNTK